MIALQNQVILPPPAKVDISLLLKPQDEEEAASVTTAPSYPPSAIPQPSVAPVLPVAAPASLSSVPPVPQLTSKIPATVPAKRLQPAHTAESPAKKQSKWSPEEDALIIELRGSGMKWEDISKRLPGRSAISCRLHYQNYLERRSEWDEDKKNKLARLYERRLLIVIADSKQRCGQKWQKRWPFRGGLQKPCTGNLENKRWLVERE
ncbi:hypothetical protein AbraIFM66950_002271 [Aspergillus brasiliensis]|nr:hypothetical protein AbraIFM66950_002271 [Aspergillus brasiliensis]